MYRVHEFAELAGVTPKALYHYDRLGLLKPRRSAAGYRIYEERDLERLAQIVALRFLDLPLRQIRTLLDGGGLRLPEALAAQKAVLEEKRQRLDLAIAAVTRAQEQMRSIGRAESTILKAIIRAIEMQTETHDSIDFMRNYYREETWSEFLALHREWPADEWFGLFREIQNVLDHDPAGARAQQLAARWRQLRTRDSQGNPTLHAGLLKAWADRQYWPDEAQRRFDGLDLARISDFVRESFSYYRRRRFGETQLSAEFQKLATGDKRQYFVEVADLYSKIGASLEVEPQSQTGQLLAARWMELVESRTGNPKAAAVGQEQYESLLRWRASWPAEIESHLARLDHKAIIRFIINSLSVASDIR